MTIRFLIISVLIGASFTAEAQKPKKITPTPTPIPALEQPVDETINPETNTKIPDEKPVESPKSDPTSRERRANSSFAILGNYAPLDVILPNKFGITAGWVQSASATYEIEYISGSVEVPLLIADLGSMSEKKIALLRKSFGGNTFNISYGLGYTIFDLTLGSDILNRVSSGAYPDLELVRHEAITANFGLGSRWTFDHGITFGIEWFNIAQPIAVTKNQNVFLERADNQGDKDAVDLMLKVLAWVPRISIAKIQLGVLF